MNRATLIVAGLLVFTPFSRADEESVAPNGTTTFHGRLYAPIGEIPFQIELQRQSPAQAVATLIHGGVREQATRTTLLDHLYVFQFDYYDAEITLMRGYPSPDVDWSAWTFCGTGKPPFGWVGVWTKRRSRDEVASMQLSMGADNGLAFVEIPGEQRDIDAVRSGQAQRRLATLQFAKEGAPAILDLRTSGRYAEGTIRTTTGDYRHMSGTLFPRGLTLSTFDAGHAILFKGVINPDGSMSGEYSSGPTYTDTWTGQWDDNAALPDPFSLTTFTGSVEALDALTFPDTGGNPRRVGDFAGKARIIELWGTWCPNCKDAAPVLAELQERYKDKGLSILGLAFEATGDAERDRRQVALYKQRFNIAYPSLIAGVRGKDSAAKAFPMLDQIRAYPSFIFIDGAGKVRGVYTGFTGPAAPEEHERLKRAFDQKVREMLGE